MHIILYYNKNHRAIQQLLNFKQTLIELKQKTLICKIISTKKTLNCLTKYLSLIRTKLHGFLDPTTVSNAVRDIYVH